MFEIYFSAIHLVAKRDYSLEQINAWAPRNFDPELWVQRIRGINPFVAEIGGKVVGYADVQNNCYIDHFFVSGYHPRQGVGKALMEEVFRRASDLHAKELSSDVGRTAQPFFENFGFQVVMHRTPVVRNVSIPNAFMRCVLQS